MIRSGVSARTQEQYDQLVACADSYILKNRFEQALSLLGQALRLMDRKFVRKRQMKGPTEKPGCLRKIAQCYKQTGNFDRARRNFHEAIELLKDRLEEGKSEATEAINLQMHASLTNLGLMELDQAESNFQCDKAGLSSIAFERLASSQQNLVQAHRLTKQQLRSGHSLQNNDWYQSYCSDLLNIVNVFQVEGNNFDCPSVLHQVVRLMNKAERFYSIHSGQIKLRSLLSKCHFQKGSAFRLLKNYKQAQIYLLKDNSYCKKHHLADDLAKNHQQLVQLYLDMNEFDKALLYIDKSDSSQRQPILQKGKMYKSFKQEVTNYDASNFSFDQYVSLADQHIEFQWCQQLVTLTKTALRLHAQRISSDQQRQMKYYLSECYWKLKKHDTALECLRECEAQTARNTKEWLKLALLKANIISESEQQNRIKVEQAYSDCIALAKRLDAVQDELKSRKNLAIYRDELHFRDLQQPEFSDDDDILQKHVLRRQPLSREEEVVDDPPSSHQQPPKKVRSYGIQYYKEKCAKHKIPVNQYVIANILTKKSFVIANIANFSEKTILILVKALVKLTVFDLSNNRVSDEFMDKLVGYIQKKKVDFSDLSTLVVSSHLKRAQNLSKILQKNPKLQTLKLCNCNLNKALQIEYSNLKILKLKHCGLTDSTVDLIPFSNMKQLNILSLKKNRLTINCFSSLNRLTALAVLNLSQNPLDGSQDQNARFSVKKLVLKQTNFSNLLVDKLFQTIKFAETLDISSSINPKLLFEALYQRYVNEHYSTKLIELKVSRIALTQQCVLFMSSFILSSPALRRLEMQWVKDQPELTAKLVEYTLGNCRDIEEVDIRGSHVPEAYMGSAKVIM